MNLIFHQAALGDWVVTFPLMRALRGTIVAVAPWGGAKLASMIIDRVQPVGIENVDFVRMHTPGGVDRVSKRTSQLLAGAEMVISFVSDGRDAWAENLAKSAPAAKRAYLQPRPPEGWQHHVGQWHTAQLQEQGIELSPGSSPPQVNLGGSIVVHPGSGGRHKCWPIKNFEDLIERLAAAGHEVRVVLGEVECDLWPRETVERWQSSLPAVVLVTRSLDDLAGEIRRASLFVGHDTGPTHLAAQVGVPTVALFGPTDPRLWAPVGPQVTVLAPPRPTAMTWLEPRQVYEIVASVYLRVYSAVGSAESTDLAALPCLSSTANGPVAS